MADYNFAQMSTQVKTNRKEHVYRFLLLSVRGVCVCVLSKRRLMSEICERLHETKATKSQLQTYWQMKWTFATCKLLSWAAVNLRWGKAARLSRTAGMLGHAAVDFQLFSLSGAWWKRRRYIVSSDQTKKKRMQIVLSKTIPYLAPAPNTSQLLFSTENFPHGDVRSAAKRAVSGSGLWSSQDVIMRYQRHHMLFLTLSFPN